MMPKEKEDSKFQPVGVYKTDYQRLLKQKLATDVGIAKIISAALDCYLKPRTKGLKKK